MKLINVFPRFTLDMNEARDLGSIPAKYLRSMKLGYDEDATTLAVNAFLELKELYPGELEEIVLGIGSCEFNLGVFLQATALDETKVVVVNDGELSGITAMEKSFESQIPFIVVDSPSSEDVLVDAVLSSAAVAGWFEEHDSYRTGRAEGTKYSRPRYSSGVFTPSEEAVLLRKLKKYTGEVTVLVSYDVRAKSRINSVVHSVQCDLGFTGAVLPVLELSNPEINSGTPVRIVGSDAKVTLHSDFLGDVDVIYQNTPRNYPLSKYLLRRSLSPHDDPGRTPQGAYISTPVYLSESASRYRLEAVICPNCSSSFFPPRPRCKRCGGKTRPWKDLSRQATVYSITNILKGASPTEFDVLQRLEGEYLVAIVELENGSRVITQITDADIQDIDIGDPVKMVFRKIYNQDNMERYGYKFVKL